MFHFVLIQTQCVVENSRFNMCLVLQTRGAVLFDHVTEARNPVLYACTLNQAAKPYPLN